MRKGRQAASIDLRDIAGLPGVHNHQNACHAYAACRAIGIGPRAIEAALRSFRGLPHRSQILGEKDGVRFVNDSKATNVQSAAMALRAFKNIRWIAGGQGKDGGLRGIGEGLANVRKAYLIGASADAFAGELADTAHVVAGDLNTAFEAAVADAEPGDTVLLAPAAASFDQFTDFEDRGRTFEALVKSFLG
jgi:UDP-N-acetylmuramoylalanine--D-glutamate ligase